MSYSESDTANTKPKNVASHLWDKFKALEKRTDDMTRASTEKRVKLLQKQITQKVTEEFTEEKDKDILRHHGVKFGPPVSNQVGHKRKRQNSLDESERAKASTTKVLHDELSSLQDYMNINDHLHLTNPSRPAPPTALENQMNEAINKGCYGEAESLSDHIAKREMGEKIVAAIDAKKFSELKAKEAESVKVKKKKKLDWGFEPKQRWETKGNM